MIDHDVAPGRLTRCQICGASDLELVFDCGSQPLCDSLPRQEDLNEPEIHYPLRLLRCTSCASCQLDYIVDGRDVYYPEYPYRSGITRELNEYLQSMAADLVRKTGLAAGSLVVDIGSNDGTLLGSFKRLGMKELGIEPTNIAKIAREAGVETLQTFFTEAVARDVRRAYGAAKLVTATNVFAHIATLGEVMRGIATLIEDDGVFVFESHYLMDVIERNQYDTIYHEHIRTYCLKPIIKLFSFYDMEVYHVERVSRYAGNIRVFTARKGRKSVASSVDKLMRAEQEFGLYDGDVYAAFRKRVEKTRDDLISMAFKAKSAGASFVGKSCPGRCSTLLNYCDIGSHFMPYIAEQPTSLKIGKYLPGKHIPIVEDERLLKDQPDYIVIFAWHYGKPIARLLRQQMGLKSKLVLPLPDVTVWDGDIPP
jgi:C-methyltransferase-like protein/putative zinc binding protein/methyltransferase family protein